MSYYTVQAGDSWESIAAGQMGNERWFGSLMSANGGGFALRPGTRVYIPSVNQNDTPFVSNELAASMGMATSGQVASAYKTGDLNARGGMNWDVNASGQRMDLTDLSKNWGPLAQMNALWASLHARGLASPLENGNLPSNFGSTLKGLGITAPGSPAPKTTSGSSGTTPLGGIQFDPNRESNRVLSQTTRVGQSATQFNWNAANLGSALQPLRTNIPATPNVPGATNTRPSYLDRGAATVIPPAPGTPRPVGAPNGTIGTYGPTAQSAAPGAFADAQTRSLTGNPLMDSLVRGIASVLQSTASGAGNGDVMGWKTQPFDNMNVDLGLGGHPEMDASLAQSFGFSPQSLRSSFTGPVNKYELGGSTWNGTPGTYRSDASGFQTIGSAPLSQPVIDALVGNTSAGATPGGANATITADTIASMLEKYTGGGLDWYAIRKGANIQPYGYSRYSSYYGDNPTNGSSPNGGLLAYSYATG
jgi:hypothetical protein